MSKTARHDRYVTRRSPQDLRDRPNVVVFFVDQQRWDSVGLQHCPLDITPNFDRLAQRGTFLPNMLTPQPVCTPARACLQTGRYATAITGEEAPDGVWKLGIPMPPTCPTFAHGFSAAGYRTGYIGKWHLASGHSDIDKGFVEPAYRGGWRDWLAAEATEHASRPYHTVMWDTDGKEQFLPGYRVDALTDAAIRYVQEHRDEPFCLMLSHIEPHLQNHVMNVVGPRGHSERFNGRWTPPDIAALTAEYSEAAGQVGGHGQQWLAGYWASIQRLDQALGRLQDALESLGLGRDTIVVYTSDHGEQFSTRSWNSKSTCHDASVRIPGAIWGGPFDGGGRVEQQASLLDIPVTLLDACGVEQPAGMNPHGRSLLPLLRDRRTPWPEDFYFQWSMTGVGRGLRTNRWKYAVTADEADADFKKDPRSPRYRETHLYDLENDPYELVNMIAFKACDGLCAILREQMLTRMVEAGEPSAEIVPAERTRGGQREIEPFELEALAPSGE